jgi:DNA-binding MarR family transcriptional regulator
MKQQLFEKRLALKRAEEALGLGGLSSTEREIYSFIEYSPTYRDQIIRHGYFEGISLSTMKRAVSQLLELELITAELDPNDKRRRVLTVTT